MTLRRSLLAAAVAAAALASPAVAEPRQDLVYTVRATGTFGGTRVDGACTFVADRVTADYGATRIDGVATTNGALRTTIRCEIESDGWSVGDVSHTTDGPASRVDGYGGFVGENTVTRFCVTATATFFSVDTDVTTGRVCTDGG